MDYNTNVFIGMTCTFSLFVKMYITNTIAGSKNVKANLRVQDDFDKLPLKKNENQDDPKIKEE